MSDLKWQTPEQLTATKAQTERYIGELQGKINNQRERLKWIQYYLYLKTPQELTMAQIEQRLGHKVILR